MTPTEEDKELDKILKSIIESYAPYYKEQGLNINYSVFQSHKAKIKQLITADRKRVELEARLGEVERELKRYGDVFNYPPHLLMRKVELKAQQGGPNDR